LVQIQPPQPHKKGSNHNRLLPFSRFRIQIIDLALGTNLKGSSKKDLVLLIEADILQVMAFYQIVVLFNFTLEAIVFC